MASWQEFPLLITLYIYYLAETSDTFILLFKVSCWPKSGGFGGGGGSNNRISSTSSSSSSSSKHWCTLVEGTVARAFLDLLASISQQEA